MNMGDIPSVDDIVIEIGIIMDEAVKNLDRTFKGTAKEKREAIIELYNNMRATAFSPENKHKTINTLISTALDQYGREKWLKLQKDGVSYPTDLITSANNLAGVVKGDFSVKSEKERFSIVNLITLSLGLMEWHRAVEPDDKTKMGAAIINLMRAIGENDFAIDTFLALNHGDINSLITKLLESNFTMSIDKFDMEEMRRLIEAEDQVLSSL